MDSHLSIGRVVHRRSGDCVHRVRPPALARHGEEKSSSGLGVIDGAVFGLMGLLLAFSFSGAVSRFETRLQFIVQETNAIGTAWLRVDLLSEAAQAEIRNDFRAYLAASLFTKT
jgi:hypothetical protein